jgi:predicted dehydrogenase
MHGTWKLNELTPQIEHLPAIEAADNLKLVAVYSRSSKSVDGLAEVAKNPVDKYYETPNEAGKSLDDLLSRNDIQAVIVALPIVSQPEVVEKALAAGKHVLSEKPVAPDVAGAKALISWYRSINQPPIWAVAENFRYVKSLKFAADKVKELGGKLVTFHLRMYNYVTKENKYFNTSCKSQDTLQCEN